MAEIKEKRIILPEQRPIFPIGGVYGPITTPIPKDIRTIGILVLNGYRVIEVLPDGTQVELTTVNFDQDNSGASADEAEKARLEAEEKEKQEAAEAARLAEEAAKKEAEEAVKAAEKTAAQSTQTTTKESGKNSGKQKPQPDKVANK